MIHGCSGRSNLHLRQTPLRPKQAAARETTKRKDRRGEGGKVIQSRCKISLTSEQQAFPAGGGKEPASLGRCAFRLWIPGEKVRMQSPVIISSSFMKSPRQRAEDGSGSMIEAQPGTAPCLTTEEDGGGGGGGSRRKGEKK